MTKTQRAGALIISLVATVIVFQNCSPVQFQGGSLDNSSLSEPSTNPPPINQPSPPPQDFKCVFNGRVLANGENVVAYQNSTVAFGSSCVSETRSCVDGVLNGSYNLSECNVGAPASCLFNGQTISHGSTVIAYESSSVNFGKTCKGETRSCNNGALSGTHTYAACAVAEPASCLFNGTSVPHGQAVPAFANSTVPYGQTCTPESRACNNGTLSGSNPFASCTVDKPASCLFNGLTIAHGQTVVAFAATSGAVCNQQTRLCTNGVLSGTYAHLSCTVLNPCPSGQTYNNSLKRCVSNSYGQACTFYGGVEQVSEVFKKQHCQLDGMGIWTGQRFCEYNSRGCGLGTCQCYTEGVIDESGICRMAANRKQAWVNAQYIQHFGNAHLNASASPATKPTINLCK